MQSMVNECAREVLEVIPLAMRGIRSELRRHGARELSIPQFRTLNFLSRHKGASLSEVAEHIGLTLPTMSTLIEGLVTRDYAIRRTHPSDRRRMTLELSDRGQMILRFAREATQSYLAQLLDTLSAAEQSTIIKAMGSLRRLFAEDVA